MVTKWIHHKEYGRFTMTTQEEALQTPWFRSQIQKEDVSPKCRLCNVIPGSLGTVINPLKAHLAVLGIERILGVEGGSYRHQS